MALLTNAMQAIGEGGGTVIVEVASDGGRLAAMRASSGSVPGVRISISDEPGVGTRFDIYLPCIGEAAAAA